MKLEKVQVLSADWYQEKQAPAKYGMGAFREIQCKIQAKGTGYDQYL